MATVNDSDLGITHAWSKTNHVIKHNSNVIKSVCFVINQTDWFDGTISNCFSNSTSVTELT